MSIVSGDLYMFPAASVSDTDPAANGGRPGAAPMSLSAKNNAFPDLDSLQRQAGASRWRKVFLANLAADDTIASVVMVVMDKPTPYADYAYFTPGDWDGHESDLSASAPIYGVAPLAADVEAGATQITLTLEHEDLAPMLAAGRELVISTKSSFELLSSTMGAEEIRTIASVTVSGTSATVTLDAALTNAYAVTAGARASVLYRPPAQAPAASDWSGGGASPVTVGNRGTVRQNWTITFTSASQFTVSGDTLGDLGTTFATDAEAAPVNPASHAGGAPYFRIPAGALDGHAAGDTITFRTYPAMTPICVRHVLPPRTDPYGVTQIPISWQAEGV